MNYSASVADFFQSPKWMMNLLLGGLSMLIPVIGPIIVLGWLITGFWSRQEEGFESFPAFDFSHFDKYLERGIWPFVVTFIVSLIMVPLLWMVMIPASLVGVLFSGNDDKAGGCLVGLVVLVVVLAFGILICTMTVVLVPLKLRAALTQDFAQAFDFKFVKRFFALTWKECLLSLLFTFATGLLFFCLGALLFCVGMYFATVLSAFSWEHLHKQLYVLYLSRGGEPIPLSPKLSGAPPLPAA